jgi:hypothetical protein
VTDGRQLCPAATLVEDRRSLEGQQNQAQDDFNTNDNDGSISFTGYSLKYTSVNSNSVH